MLLAHKLLKNSSSLRRTSQVWETDFIENQLLIGKILQRFSNMKTRYFLFQDNYTFAQPGIQMKVNTLKNLVNRIDCMSSTFFSFFILKLHYVVPTLNHALAFFWKVSTVSVLFPLTIFVLRFCNLPLP